MKHPRSLVRFVVSAAGLLAAHAAWALTATPSTTEGPYYTLSSANNADKSHFTGEGIDNDLTHIYSTSTQCTTTSSCPLFLLSGTLVNTSGTAISGATIELWEADSGGIYWYTSSSSTTNAYANRDQNFQGYGQCVTDSSGAWSFRTIKPGLYTGRIRHFHFKVRINGTVYLTSQFMFSEDSSSFNSDGVMASISSSLRPLVTITPVAGTDSAGNYALVVADKQIVVSYSVSSSAPTITTQPYPFAIAAGGSATFTVAASGSGTLSYQWYKDGAAVSGATSAAYALSSATTASAGSYYCVVSNSSGSVASDSVGLMVTTATDNTTHALTNLSARALVPSAGTLIAGFWVQSTDGKRVLLRALGDSLVTYAPELTGEVVSDPKLTLYDGSGSVIDSNDDWSSSLSSTFTSTGAAPLTSTADSALLTTRTSGGFTAHVTSSTAGIALAEAYDADTATTTSRLLNLSARAYVGTGDNVLIAGFVIGGTGGKQILIRAIGPKLTDYSVTGVLADPQLSLYDSSGTLIAYNDDWSSSLTSTFTATGAFSLDAGSKDAAMLVTLPADAAYTAIVRGASDTTGEALVEVYEVP